MVTSALQRTLLELHVLAFKKLRVFMLPVELQA